ncbi:MAG: hypothetical protein KGK08_07740 [Acidobacteriota bacterium]|nr:hypothetical protein [Acidobacteriota bacterium]
MKLRFLAAAATLALAAHAAYAQQTGEASSSQSSTASPAASAPAQVSSATPTERAPYKGGLYLNPYAVRISNTVADTGTFAFLGSGNKSAVFYGVTFGGYYDFAEAGKLHAGLEVRDSLAHGHSASINSFLVGARVSGQAFSRPIKPYALIAVGAGTTRSATNPVHITRLQYGVYAGADYPLNRHFDWRTFEVGYGSVTTVSNDTVGGTASIPASTAISFTTGFVIRY